MKKLVFALSVYAAFLFVAGCQKEPMLDLLREDSIRFTVNEIFNVETKATAVTSLSSFNVSAVTGSAGSETAVWTNASFTDAGESRYAGDKYWPLTNDNPYRFYASNATLSYAATGATVTVNTDTDVVCAYLSSPTYKGVNALTFEHIFARIGDVTVSAATGYTITGVSISITPKTSGTFNLLTGDGETDGTGWSATSNGSAYALANATPGTKSNDLYLIPGTYTLTATWTATRGEYTQTFSDKTYDVEIVGGKINSITTTLGGLAEEIKFTVSINPWGSNAIEAEFPTSDNPLLGKVDLSTINPLTGAEMTRETANCYVVTEYGDYCLPLFYGNAVVNGADNISTAAPAKSGNSSKGVFVNAYDVAISSGNIKTDLEAAGQTLNTSGGKLIWSTESAISNALVTVDSEIYIEDGVGYLCFSVPSDRFQEGSALIGVLKSGSTTEYVWAWHIWITNGRVLATEEYTNYQSNRIDILNRPLGGRGGTSATATYYQFGMPFPIPPSNGSNATATLYDENGTYTFNYDSEDTINTLGKALSKPYLPRWNNDYFNTPTGTTQSFYNIWDATQTYRDDKAVVKTIYDPSPAGMSVPRKNAFTGFTTTGASVDSDAPTNCNVVGSFGSGWYFKKNSSDATGSFWSASGCRYYSTTFFFVGSGGHYWSACRYNRTSAWVMLFYSYRVSPTGSNDPFYAYSVRPSLVEN